MPKRHRAATAFLVAVAAALSGCGYHISGQGDAMPRTMKIVAVPPLGNVTSQPKLGTVLTADITRELISRTHYTVVSDPAQADGLLTGTVTNFAAFPTILDPVSGRATGVEVAVTLQLTLADRHTGKILYRAAGTEFRERYEVALDPQQYFDEGSTAILRVSRDVARSVVSAILESF